MADYYIDLQIFGVFVQVLLNMNISLIQNSPDILALCETNLDDSIDSGNFSLRGYLPLIRKDSITHVQDFLLHGTYF